jgi:acylglycerol lipase
MTGTHDAHPPQSGQLSEKPLPPTSWTLRSGARVHVWAPEHPPRGMVVLQHGFVEYAERYVGEHHQLIAHLLGRGYEVWAMDLIGHGRSPGRRRLTNVHCGVADHVLVRERLRAKGVPIILFGHSLGGLAAAGSVAPDPSDIAGVVLSAPVLVPPVRAPVRADAWLLGRSLPRVAVPERKGPLDTLTRRRDVIERAGGPAHPPGTGAPVGRSARHLR